MHHPILTIGIQAAEKASRVILARLERLDRMTIHKKMENDFVTDVDQRSEAIIIEIIKNAYPHHTIIAEESDTPNDPANDPDYVWIIDPLDGTSNYIHGFPQFAISIAFKQKNKLEAAVIYDPMRQELFTAARGRGAQLDNHKIRVSRNKLLHDALIGTGFPFKQKQNIESYLTCFTSIFKQVSDIRRAGSAALDLAYIAAGRLDGFWESGLSPWDTAAGGLLIKEAGGFITDFNGDQAWETHGKVIAGNPSIHESLIKIIQAHEKNH